VKRENTLPHWDTQAVSNPNLPFFSGLVHPKQGYTSPSFFFNWAIRGIWQTTFGKRKKQRDGK
jgi:hypothetical protein